MDPGLNLAFHEADLLRVSTPVCSEGECYVEPIVVESMSKHIVVNHYA